MSQFFVASSGGGPPPPEVATQYTCDTGVAVPSANNLNVFGGVGATTNGSGSTITVTVVTDGFAWSEQTANFNAASENGYYCNNALTVTLPATAGLLIGNTVIVFVDTSSTVTIQANTGQMIQVGSTISSTAGTAASNTRGALLELNFKPSDSTWHTISSMGSWSLT